MWKCPACQSSVKHSELTLLTGRRRMDTGDKAPVTGREFYNAFALVWTFIMLAFRTTTVFGSRSTRVTRRQTITARAASGPPDDRCGSPDRSWTVVRVYPDDRGPRGVLSSVRRDRQLI
jgi:hypothetical protein